MELNITEIENEHVEDIGYVENNVFYPNAQFSKKTKTPILNVVKEPVKKQVSYDDILNSLNMKLIDGKLQISRNDKQVQNQNHNQHMNMNMNQYQNYHQHLNPNMNTNMNKKVQLAARTSKTRHLPIPIEEKPIVRRPLTKQEAMIQYLKMIQERKRISEIKSTKLLFSTNPDVKIASSLKNRPLIDDKFFKLKGR
jgi:hypothetical protein